jgi:diaminopimelate epimerase
MDGGPLHIAWAENDHVIMTGPVELEFTGEL